MYTTAAALILAAAAAAAAVALPVFAQQAQSQQTCATVEVDNVRAQKGHLMVAAFNSADTFQKEPLSSLRIPAGDARMSFQLCGLSGTHVALTLFQDLDSDGKMNKNMVGMPTEPWGSSGTPGSFGPTWETGKVALDGKPISVALSK